MAADPGTECAGGGGGGRARHGFIGRIARIVTVFHQGGILKEGSFAQIIADPRVRDVYLGRGAAHEPADGQPSVVRLWPHPVLDGVRFHVGESNSWACSATAAWKSTLLKTLMGVLPASAGESARMWTSPICLRMRARLGMGYVPQGRGIFPGLSVLDNLRFSAKANPGRTWTWKRSGRVSALEALASRPGGALSGGEQQLLALARAWSLGPGCCCWTNPPKASSLPSSTRSWTS